jgi:hypothetical protein
VAVAGNVFPNLIQQAAKLVDLLWIHRRDKRKDGVSHSRS